jgi:nucleoid-associated protein
MFVENKLSFADGSRQLLHVLAAKANDAPLSTGGYVLMAQLTNAAQSWFIVAMIKNVPSSAIDDETLEIIKTVHVDLPNLRVAGRVNLTDWQAGDPQVRYVGFLKQRGDVAEYFKNFLGCDELLQNREETRKLVSTLKTFAHAQNLKPDEVDTFLRAAHNYCFDCNKNSEPLSLEALCNVAWPQNPTVLQESLAGAALQIADAFVPDRTAIRSLVRIKASTAYWSLDLKREALQAGVAHYNPTQGTLTLSDLPAHLKQELELETKEDGDDQ